MLETSAPHRVHGRRMGRYLCPILGGFDSETRSARATPPRAGNRRAVVADAKQAIRMHTMANETLLLIDGSHMANRAWHTRELHTSDGLDTSVLHGVLEGIQIECERFATGRFLVVWDAPGRTFR